MSEHPRIAPALTPEEWERVQANEPTQRISIVDDVSTLDPDDLVAAIAIANYTLPDDDPRKLTYERAVMVRSIAEERAAQADESGELGDRLSYEAWKQLADALESLLPP